jgi:hypothetical protein
VTLSDKSEKKKKRRRRRRRETPAQDQFLAFVAQHED